jgi:hypothetical protein
MPCFARPLFVKEGLKSLSKALLVEREVGSRSTCKPSVVMLVEFVSWKPFHNPVSHIEQARLSKSAHVKPNTEKESDR